MYCMYVRYYVSCLERDVQGYHKKMLSIAILSVVLLSVVHVQGIVRYIIFIKLKNIIILPDRQNDRKDCQNQHGKPG